MGDGINYVLTIVNLQSKIYPSIHLLSIFLKSKQQLPAKGFCLAKGFSLAKGQN